MVRLLSAAEVDEYRNTLIAEAEALVDIAREDDRELSADEQTRFDEIHAQIPDLDNRFQKLTTHEQRVQQKITNRIQTGDIKFGQGTSEATNKVTVPAKARSHRKLTAFDNEQDAYVAGQYALTAFYGNASAKQWCNDHGIVNVMSEGDNTKGGYLVPEEMARALVRLREERGVFERYARVIPMGSDSMLVPREIGDVTAYWTGENDEITASDTSIGNAELVAKKIACLTRMSTELDEDSVVEIGDLITRSMAYAMADKVDEAGFNGDGTSTYGGVMGLKNALNASAINDALTGNDSALTLDLADFEAAVGSLPQYPSIEPAWYVHSAVYWASMARLMDAGGGNRVQDLGSGPVMQFLGYPVRFTQVLPSTTGTLASTIVAYFGDLRLAATVGRRRGITTKVSEDRYFEFDQVGIQCTQRMAINVHERGDTIKNRPVVALKTAS